MNEVKRKIILYLDNQLSDKEKIKFEKELENSEELRNAFEKYKAILKEIKNSEHIEVDQNYFNSLTPRVLEKVNQNKKRKLIPVYALSLAVSIIIIFFIFFNNGKKDNINNSLKDIASNLSKEELIETINSLPDQNSYLDPTDNFSDFNITDDSMIADALSFEIKTKLNNNLDFLLEKNIDYGTLISSLDEQEADKVYSEIINKRYF